MKTFTRQSFQQELTGNILPFWIEAAVDHTHGGFYGAVTNDRHPIAEAPKGGVLCARILWTFAAAYRALGDATYLDMAQRACDYLTQRFWDAEHGGVYWLLDYRGRPLADRKQTYAQAFAVYALAEYHRATRDETSLHLAQELFRLIETHAYERVHGGYLDARSRAWGDLDDMRLAPDEPHSRKSMNTLLHVLEAYTNLRRVWDDATLRARHRELIELFLTRVVAPAAYHFKLFFDDEWRSLYDHISFGHDIEGSWLLVEAAEVEGDESLLERTRDVAVRMAQAVYDEGLEANGGITYEAGPRGVVTRDKQWWTSAEAVVGFYNAYQISGQAHFEEAARRCWRYIGEKWIDRTHGDWFKRLDGEGRPYPDAEKAGPWHCPYHHARMCLEMMGRI